MSFERQLYCVVGGQGWDLSLKILKSFFWLCRKRIPILKEGLFSCSQESIQIDLAEMVNSSPTSCRTPEKSTML